MTKLQHSPYATFRSHLEAGELAYQFDEASGTPVFYPRVLAPSTGSDRLTWRLSQGLGIVHATTTLYPRNELPYNVALIDMEEGFRLMSRVESVPAEAVHIGMRVKVRVHAPADGGAPYPVFDPVHVP